MTAQPAALPPADDAPTYTGAANKREVFAHFRSGLVVRAGRTRTRAYPGLRGAAPPTEAFYRALGGLTSARSVLDAGAGSGIGTRELCAHFEHVTAVELDPETAIFCREYAPKARTLRADLETPLDERDVDVAVFADVLGHLRQPERALSHVRLALSPGGHMLVAEPAASVLQRLAAPARRAYSTRQLARVLVRGGFVPQRWLCEAGTFVACVARPSHDPASDALLEALAALSHRDASAARAAAQRAAHSEQRGIVVEAALVGAAAAVLESDGDGAVRAYSAAEAKDPDNPSALAGLAEVLMLTGDKAGALALAIQAARIDPTEPLAARVAAQAATDLGHPEALSAWRLAVNLMPDQLAAVSELARLSAERGDFALGITAFERLRTYGDDHGLAFHLTLAWLLVAEGRRSDARMEARVATALCPEDPDVIELTRALSA